MQILDEDHFGLIKVKDRIIEYLAVRNLKQKKDPSKKSDVPKKIIIAEKYLSFS